MKILGEKSLSSKVIVGLKGLFTIISIVDLLVIETIVKVIIELIGMENVEKSVASLILFIMIIATGIIALFIIYQFIKIFQHLKDNEYDHLVTIYYDVTINNDVNLINSEDVTCDENGYYSYQNGEYTDNGRYQFGTKKEYYATEKSALFKGKYYSLELAN